MYSIEFETKSENGFIKIPDEYKDLNAKNMKVILIVEENIDKKDYIDEFFESYSVDLSSIKFNREDANER